MIDNQTRLIVLAIVNAYAICRAIFCAGRMLDDYLDRVYAPTAGA